MKKFFLVTAVAALLVFVIGISSCEKPAPNKAFLGSYSISGSCIDGTTIASLPVVISAGTSSSAIILTFGGVITLKGTVSGSNFTIPDQDITDNSGTVWTYNGNGSVTGSFLSLTYYAGSSAGENQCALTGSK